ncbi:hypothetical protein PoB_001630100 [Plakobranchus ocellatus]|uniref:Spaetzle domain-containing protein n=1 Tax=Plakobranchus ocellatus TaxID=259542 RepID=A0AAV3YRN0_9GAST|nr:hypothetical protein PoB_001630100 [Plakobranchus ocellatus]
MTPRYFTMCILIFLAHRLDVGILFLDDDGVNFIPKTTFDAIFGSDYQILRDANGELMGVIGGKDDGSISCSTVPGFFFNSTLVDYFDNMQTIAQKRQVGAFQAIYHGFCGKNKGLCTGECEQKYITVSLAIYPPKPNQNYSFSYFKVPGYCACMLPASGPSLAMTDDMTLDTSSSHASYSDAPNVAS